MVIDQRVRADMIQRLIQSELKPYVKQIDEEAYYPIEYLTGLGKAGLLQSAGISEATVRLGDVQLIEETAHICATTGFNLWCHLAASTYLRKSGRPFLMNFLLPLLEEGQCAGGTGLSNPMKFYAGLEKLCLKAYRVEGGYRLTGQLPNVSNLGPNHSFGIIASVDEQQRIMAFVPHDAAGLRLTEKRDFLALNGSATYACKFADVFLPMEWVITENADSFVERIRATFILYQIPLALGIVQASIQSMVRARQKQGGCNRYLAIQPEAIESQWEELRGETYQLAASVDLDGRWLEVLKLRLAAVNLALTAAHGAMLHTGGSAYIQTSDPARRLREVYFLAHLTPTIKHLEKLIAQGPSFPQ